MLGAFRDCGSPHCGAQPRTALNMCMLWTAHSAHTLHSSLHRCHPTLSSCFGTIFRTLLLWTLQTRALQ